MALESTFHATEDPQAVRDQVFNLLTRHDFRVDSTIIHKRKTIPRLQADHERFYKQLWFLHFKYVCPRVTRGFDDMLVVAAQIGTKKRRKAIRYGIADVVNQSAGCNWEVAFWPADSDPLLQVADYCCWAIQRKYERDDTRSYDLISDKVRSEFQPFRNGAVRY